MGLVSVSLRGGGFPTSGLSCWISIESGRGTVQEAWAGFRSFSLLSKKGKHKAPQGGWCRLKWEGAYIRKTGAIKLEGESYPRDSRRMQMSAPGKQGQFVHTSRERVGASN